MEPGQAEVCNEHEKKLHSIEISMTKLDGDVSHIKSRLDNGISLTLNSINASINEIIKPMLKDHDWWVGTVRFGFKWITIIAIGGGLAAISFGIIKKVAIG